VSRNADDVAASIRKLMDALITEDQRKIGIHETVTVAQADLRDSLRAAIGSKERAS